jgi:hypothetical protein
MFMYGAQCIRFVGSGPEEEELLVALIQKVVRGTKGNYLFDE